MHKMILWFGFLLSIFLFSINQSKAQWVQTDTLPGQPVFALANSGNNLFCSPEFYGAYISTNSGNSWSPIDSGLTDNEITDFAVLGTNLFAATGDSGIFITTNTGSYWSHVGLIDTTVYSLAVSGLNVYAGTDNGVFLSTDNGTNWTQVNNGLTDTIVMSLAASDSILLAGTLSSGVFLSTNNGESWSQRNNGLPPPDYPSFIPVAIAGNYYFVDIEGHGVYVSSDGGVTWVGRNIGLMGTDVSTFFVLGPNIFAGGIGAYLTTNYGTNWTSVSDGLPQYFPLIVSFAILDTNLFAGGDRGLVYRRPLSQMVTNVKDKQDDLPLSYSLEQNYPNPFNPSTKINYSLPHLSNVVIKIFDVLGREIETLVNEEKTTGTYDLTWNAANLPSGVYFYQLKAGSFIETKKMILLK